LIDFLKGPGEALHQLKKRSCRKRQPERARIPREPMPHVISLRVNREEKQLLEQIGRKTSKNMSAVVREALEYWLSR